MSTPPPQDWSFVPSAQNPSDHGSRGLGVTALLEQEDWGSGPSFLWLPKTQWPSVKVDPFLPEDHPDLKKEVISLATNKKDSLDQSVFAMFSDWHRLKRFVASLIVVQDRCRGVKHSSSSASFDQWTRAEQSIVQAVQDEGLAVVKQALQEGRPLSRDQRSIGRLLPFVDAIGLVRVGGRLQAARVPFDAKHPIIVPKKSHVATLLVRAAHAEVGHLGHRSMLTKLRQRYKIIGDTALAKKIKNECVICRKYEAKPMEQIMANLPKDRVEADVTPFTSTGLDLFGPFEIKQGRSRVKRYGVIFTCLSSRSNHLEVAHSLDTSSLIQALRRFIARRGSVKTIRSDNGTNLVGGEKELGQAIQDWNQEQVDDYLKQKGIKWIRNAPTASHFGGVWEREIRTIRKILSGLVKEQPMRLDDEAFRTLMCEVEFILNSRPLSPLSDDPDELDALTPNHLILGQAGSTLPPGLFDVNDGYSRRRWRQVQYLANLFWSRWRKEYMSNLHSRQKWLKKKKNLKTGDLVLLVEKDRPRNHWPLGRVVQTLPDHEGAVRVVRVKTLTNTLERPISKLVLLRSKSEGDDEEDDGADDAQDASCHL